MIGLQRDNLVCARPRNASVATDDEDARAQLEQKGSLAPCQVFANSTSAARTELQRDAASIF